MVDLEKNNIDKYCEEHSFSDSKLLLELKQYTLKNEDVPQMISGQMVGKFLQSIIKMIRANRIVEIGTFTGYSALQMAEAISLDGEIHTCELMDKHAKTAQTYFNKSQYKKQITIHKGPALETLEKFKIGSFDLAFIDADKINYLEYYKRCFMLVRVGGVIILDNMLWSGSVINPKDDDAKALRNIGDYIQKDKRVFNMLFPIRDGLMLCIKNEK